MLIELKNVLGVRDIKQVQDLLAQANFVDGKLSAGMAAQALKNNQEISSQHTQLLDQLNQTVMGNLLRHKHYQRAALPLHIASPFYARYEVGMEYGQHLDDPIMGEQHRYRSDMAITVFLNAPDEYQGGELEMHSQYGIQVIKLAAGDAILYPANMRHAVKPVTQGRRLVAVTWVQSLVRDNEQRQLLYELGCAREKLLRKQPDEIHTQQVDQAYLNLVRRWSDC